MVKFTLQDAIAAVGVMLKDSKTFHGMCLAHQAGCADSKELLQFDKRRRVVGTLLEALGTALQEEALSPAEQTDWVADQKTHIDETPEGRGEGETYPDPDDELAAPTAAAMSESGMGLEIEDEHDDEGQVGDEAETAAVQDMVSQEEQISDSELLDLILLVEDPAPTIEEIRGWTLEQMREVYAWATAKNYAYAHADAVVPETPAVLTEWLEAREEHKVPAAGKGRKKREALSEV